MSAWILPGMNITCDTSKLLPAVVIWRSSRVSNHYFLKVFLGGGAGGYGTWYIPTPLRFLTLINKNPSGWHITRNETDIALIYFFTYIEKIHIFLYYGNSMVEKTIILYEKQCQIIFLYNKQFLIVAFFLLNLVY